MAWLQTRGGGTYANAYLSMLEMPGEHRDLENWKGRTLTSAANLLRKRDPDIKSYITPKLYDGA